MLRTVVIDDESLALEHTVSVLERNEELLVAGAYTVPEEALDQISQQDTDLVFLDISMPGMNGFEVADEILKTRNNTKIVFLSGYCEYAIKAFELDAIDYILKPLSAGRLSITIKRILHRYENSGTSGNYVSDSSRKLNDFIGRQINESKLSRIAGWKNERIRLFKPEEVIYFYSEGKKTLIYTDDGIFEFKGCLNDLEKRLDENMYFRCHRSFLINLDYVEYVDPWFNQTYIAKLKNVKEDIPVSRTSAKAFKKLISV